MSNTGTIAIIANIAVIYKLSVDAFVSSYPSEKTKYLSCLIINESQNAKVMLKTSDKSKINLLLVLDKLSK